MIASLTMILTLLGGPKDSLLHRYFPNWDLKEWKGTTIAPTNSDYLWQPKLLVLLPETEKSYPTIAEKLNELRKEFEPKGLVTLLFTDLSKIEAEKVHFEEGSVVAFKAQSVFAKCKAKKAPIAFLVGLDSIIAWEGNPSADAGALRAEIIKQLKESEKIEISGDFDAKLLEAKTLIERKHFKEADKLLNKLSKDQSLAKEIGKLSLFIDHYYAAVAAHAKKLMDGGESYEAFLLWNSASGELVEEGRRYLPLIELGADWELKTKTHNHLWAARKIYEAEEFIRDEKYKAARSKLKELVDTYKGTLSRNGEIAKRRLDEVDSWL